MKTAGDSREGFLVIVGFYAADIVRSGRVQGLHQEVERVAELKREEKTGRDMSALALPRPRRSESGGGGTKPDVRPSSCDPCWEL